MARGQHLVRVHLEPTPDVRSTLAALNISVLGAESPRPFTAQLEADSTLDAVADVQHALRPRWGEVRVEPLGPVG